MIAQHHRCTSWWRFVPHWSWIQLSETNVHFFQQITHFLFRTSMQTMWCRRWLMWLSQVRSVWFRLFINISCSLQTFKSQLQLKLGLVFHLLDWSFWNFLLSFLASSLFLHFAVYLFVSVCFFSANFKNCWLLPYWKLMNLLPSEDELLMNIYYNKISNVSMFFGPSTFSLIISVVRLIVC